MQEAVLDLPDAPPTPAPARPRGWTRLLPRLACLGVGGWLAFFIGDTFLGTNFHVVLPGKVFRSAQPGRERLKTLVHRHGIRTVLNLRGLCIGHPWYMEQCETVQDLGIAQEDLSFSAHRIPSAHELCRLIDVLDRAETPILLHCRQGADRTGMAAVVARLLYTEDTLPEALSHLSWRYGHLPVGKTLNMDRFFDLYTQWLGDEGKEHSPAVFRHWASQEYRGGWCQHAIESFEPMQGACKSGEPLGFRVRLRNISPRPWRFSPYETAGVHLAVEVLSEKNTLARFVRAGLFERVVAPDETVELIVAVPPLYEPGRYRLRMDMIAEGHCWFQQAGAEARVEEIVVHE